MSYIYDEKDAQTMVWRQLQSKCKGYTISFMNKENTSIFSPQISNESKMHEIQLREVHFEYSHDKLTSIFFLAHFCHLCMSLGKLSMQMHNPLLDGYFLWLSCKVVYNYNMDINYGCRKISGTQRRAAGRVSGPLCVWFWMNLGHCLFRILTLLPVFQDCRI